MMEELETRSADHLNEILNKALPPNHAEIPDRPEFNRAIERELTNHINPMSGTNMESQQEQVRQRRELFGNDYSREYMGRNAIKGAMTGKYLSNWNKNKQSKRKP